MIRNDTH